MLRLAQSKRSLLLSIRKGIFNAQSNPQSEEDDPLRMRFFKKLQVNEAPWTPQKLVQYLDRFVIGQPSAKRAIACAFRNRWRRRELTNDFQQQIIPKNLLIKGPTGSGKTELARRLARLTNSPFVRVQATKYTQVGYVGKDVNSIIQDNKNRHIQLQGKT